MKLVVKDDAIKRFVKSLSEVRLGTSFFEAVGTVIAGDIIGNIESGTQADGSAIKSNAPGTIAKKRRQGNSPVRSLIDVERRFVRRGRSSWNWIANSKSVTIEPTSVGSTPLHELVTEVQEKGYRGWFGISKKGKAAIRKIFEARLRKLLKESRR